MKYVKLTNDCIYDVRHLKIDSPIKDGLSSELFVAHSGKSYGSSMPGVILLNHLCNVNDIVKEADTIEELCDCFVVYEKGGGFAGEHRTYNDLEFAKYEANEYVSIVYGGIWTEKGLIYVAKMNDKGELELL